MTEDRPKGENHACNGYKDVTTRSAGLRLVLPFREVPHSASP